jgi:hypothetical protein
LGLRLWLEPLGDFGEASETASFWKNDRYLLLPDGEDSTAVIWDIELESSEATDRLQTAALARISAMAGAQDIAKAGEILQTPEQRNLVVRRVSPSRLRFIHSATRALAEGNF